MIGLSSILLQKKWNTFTLSNIYILMHNNTFPSFFWKHEIFTVPGGLKIENFKYCKSSISWNLQNDPRVPRLAQIARMSFLIMYRCVMDMQRHRNHYFLNLHTPSTSLKKKMDHRKYAENLIFQSRFSCWFWELIELLMALKWSLRSSLCFCSIV